MFKFPYGVSDFYKIITQDYFYVDHTDYIPRIEQAGSQLLFLRPRRFGKSLLLSMLENYYDVAKAGEFERLFGHLAIGQAPTPLHNQYLVLKWDFSVVDPQGDVQAVKRALHDHVNNSLKTFARRYQHLLPFDVEIKPDNAISSFESASAAVQASPHQMYLLIDEYDNFANEILMAERSTTQDRYEALLYGEGALKTAFKAVKAASTGGGLDRIFIAGVSPVVLSDVTSGFNIAKSIYLEPEFNALCGFGKREVADMLRQIVVACGLPVEKASEALTMMRVYYNGYRFADEQTLIYNPTLALYFMEHLQKHGQYPREMLDSNLAMDRDKISYISQLPGGKVVIANALSEEHPLSIRRLADRFGVKDVLYALKDHTFMASLLYYFGVLTFGGTSPKGKFVLQIPNMVVRRLYVERIQEMLLPDLSRDEAQRVAEIFYSSGDMQPLCDFIERRYFKVFDNRDYRWSNELTVKTAFLTLLFDDTFYIMDSETALERDYADLTMILRPEMRKYQLLDILIEFKYISLQEAGLAGAEVKALTPEQLESLEPVQRKLAESRHKLQGYHETLQAAYGDVLRLHVYSVVAVGFERLVWVEITQGPSSGSISSATTPSASFSGG